MNKDIDKILLQYLNQKKHLCLLCIDKLNEYTLMSNFSSHLKREHDTNRIKYAKMFRTEEWVTCPICKKHYFKESNEKQYFTCRKKECRKSWRLPKYKETCKKKYGTENYFSSLEGKAHIKEVMLKKYGVECSSFLDSVKSATRSFWADKEGSKHARFLQSESLKRRYKNKEASLKPDKVIINLKEKNYQKYLETCQKISDSVCKFIENNPEKCVGGRNSKRGYCYNPFIKKFEYMQSSWENALAKLFISMNVPYIKNTKFSIKYIKANGNEGKYIPDFLLEHSREMIEVKGFEDENTKLKIGACVDWCKSNNYQYFLLRYEDLKNLEVDFNCPFDYKNISDDIIKKGDDELWLKS